MMTAFSLSLVGRWWWWWWWWYPERIPTERIPIGIRSVGILGVCHQHHHHHHHHHLLGNYIVGATVRVSKKCMFWMCSHRWHATNSIGVYLNPHSPTPPPALSSTQRHHHHHHQLRNYIGGAAERISKKWIFLRAFRDGIAIPTDVLVVYIKNPPPPPPAPSSR